MDLLRQAVHGMLASLQMPEVGETEPHDLILRISHTGELRELAELLPLD